MVPFSRDLEPRRSKSIAKPRFLKGHWHACARLYQSPTPEHMGCLLDKKRRRQPWLQTRHLLCPQPRKLQHLTSQWDRRHHRGAFGAPAVLLMVLRCQMLQLSSLQRQQMSCRQPRLPTAVFVQQRTHVRRGRRLIKLRTGMPGTCQKHCFATDLARHGFKSRENETIQRQIAFPVCW